MLGELMSEPAIIKGEHLHEVLRESVQKAIAERAIKASEMTEFYLVNLLAELQSLESLYERLGPDSIERPMSIQLLEAQSGDLRSRIRALKKLGDTALVVSGFFSEGLGSELVDQSYYITIGGSAYGSLAYIVGETELFAETYSELAVKFAAFADVLTIVAPWNKAVSNSDLIKIYERWLATGDEYLETVLAEKGIAPQKKT